MNKITTIIKESLTWFYIIIKNFLTSKDMKAIYWTAFAQVIAGGLDLVITQLTAWNPDHLITIFAGLVIARITKRLNK